MYISAENESPDQPIGRGHRRLLPTRSSCSPVRWRQEHAAFGAGGSALLEHDKKCQRLASLLRQAVHA